MPVETGVFYPSGGTNDQFRLYYTNNTTTWTTNVTTIQAPYWTSYANEWRWQPQWQATYIGNWQTEPNPWRQDPEAIERYRRLAREAEEQRKQELAERKETWKQAEAVAEDLLLQLLGADDFGTWKRDGHVLVISRRHENLAYQIKAYEEIRLLKRCPRTWQLRGDRLCIHLRERHPAGDDVAAKVLLARFDEKTLWEQANHHGAIAA